MKPDKKYQLRVYDEEKGETAVSSFDTPQEVVAVLEEQIKNEPKPTKKTIPVR